MQTSPVLRAASARFLHWCLSGLLLAEVAVRAAAPWGTPIMQPGIAALTCAAQKNPLGPTNAFPFGLVDLRTPPGGAAYTILGPTATLWNPPMYHHPDWSVDKIGCVFGITVDRDGNIYLAAHSLYVPFWGPPWFGNPYLMLGSLAGPNPTNASGTIYRVDALTGNVTVFAVLPQQADPNLPWNPAAGPGLGNLTYDPAHDQFFATNLEDGKIYRLTKSGITGVIAEVFDPLTSDNGLPGMPPLGDRLWAIEVSGTNVFYSVWNVGNATNPAIIRSVGIASSGALVPASDSLVLTVPGSGVASPGGTTVPVSDLSFSLDGKTMILAERGMFKAAGSSVFPDYYATGNHYARVLRATMAGTSWLVSHGVASGKNASTGEGYGGADFGPEAGAPEALVWMSSADMATGAGPHGIQGLRQVDFPSFPPLFQAANSYLVPYDPAYTASGPDVKGIGGDVEILRETACSRLTPRPVACPDKPDQPFTVVIDVQNLSGVTALYGWWNPCPTNDLPPGAVTAQPLPASIFPLPGGALTNQGTATLTLQLPAGLGGRKVCFLLTLLDDLGRVCCTQKVCVELPACDCARVLAERIECVPQADGSVSYTVTLTLQNLTHLSSNPFPIYHATFLPPTGFNPANVTPTPTPIPPGGTGTITFTYVGLPGRLCFTLGLHDRDIEPCCFIPVCLDLPDCRDDTKPDICALEPVTPCREGPLGPGMATINYTLCNNSTAPRTYTWSANGTSLPPCTQTLLPDDFSPSSGVITLGPGTCTNITITVSCRGWRPGDCAGYTICATTNAVPGVPVPGGICCEGMVRRTDLLRPVVFPIPGPDGGGAPILAPDATVTLRLGVENPGGEALDTTLLLFSQPQVLRLDVTGAPGPGAEALVVPLSLPAGGRLELPVQVQRSAFAFGPVQVAHVVVQAAPGHWSLAEFPLQPPTLVLPVILQDSAGPGVRRPRIMSIQVEPGPAPFAVLRLTVQSGVRHRLERAASPAGPWRPVSDVEGLPATEGEFIVPTDEVQCRIPCGAAEMGAFFRLVALP